MAGKGSELRERVRAALKAALDSAAPGDQRAAIDAVRKLFPDVPRRTWALWVGQVTNRGALLEQRVTEAVSKVDHAIAQRKRDQDAGNAPSGQPRRRRRGVVAEGEHIPADRVGGAPAPGSVPGDGVTRRFTQPPAVPVEPMDLIVQLGQLLLDAEALRDCSIRSIHDGEGHIIVDPLSFSQSIAMRLQITTAQGKMYGEMLLTQNLRKLLSEILVVVRSFSSPESPNMSARLAAKILELTRKYRKDFEL